MIQCYNRFNMLYKNTIKIWGQRLLMSLLFLGLVYIVYLKVFKDADWYAEVEASWLIAKEKSFSWVILLVSLTLINFSLEGLRWQQLLTHIHKISWVKAIQSVFSGVTFAIITPNKIGDFAGRIIYLPPNKKLAGALATLVGGLAQTTVTFIFGIASLSFFNYYHPSSWAKTLLGVAVLGLVAILWGYFNMHRLGGLAKKNKSIRILRTALWTLSRFDKRQLLKVLGISALRFTCYNLQFILLIHVLGAGLIWYKALFLVPLMFWLITLIPSFFLADIGVRSFITYLVFIEPGIVENEVVMIGSSLVIWLFNLILPALIGLIFIFLKMLQDFIKKTPSKQEGVS